jgi:deazaflavin-dependent oxidoreductase (nitroreductase family)
MAEPDTNDRNQSIIEAFHTNQGKVGGPFASMPLLLLTTTGAKSSKTRVNPLAYLSNDERLFIFASYGGAPSHPDWYYNILAQPNVTVELGTEKFAAKAVDIEDRAERDQIYGIQSQLLPGFAEYQTKTTRVIPVVELVRQDS